MISSTEQPILDFYRYPPIGDDDWRYTYETAVVRVLEMQMLTKSTLLDIANAENFEAAVHLLSSSEYAPAQGKDFAQVENILQLRRSTVRELFADFMLDKPIVELFKARDDFSNIRLAVRRVLTERPLGTDYSNDGTVPAEQFKEIFEEENYSPLPLYMRQAIEEAVLGYYKNKDVRRIDYAIDNAQAEYNVKRAIELNSRFLLELFRMQIDLTNIRTMLRLKFTESEERNVFPEGGYIGQDRLRHGLDVSYEAIAALFFTTPYSEVVESGVTYFIANKSFLKIEECCRRHLNGFLKSTVQISAGPQPVIAYLLMKENEIRTVRLILTAKKHNLVTKPVLDCLSE
ncbi:MAG: V-type ATPase subunit [Planctomycetota bacterium]|jgi:V/A-type H+-transporting ATPase subunit C